MFRIRVADHVFEVNTKYPDTEKQCSSYLVEDEPDTSFTISKEDLCFERKRSVLEAESEGIPVPNFSESELESTAVYRKIADYLSYQDACVFHGALIAYQGQGYLFTAKSGTGKTTHILNWLKQYPDAMVINGDKPILRLVGREIIGFGTPWCGKEGMNTNRSVPLKAVIFLNRGSTNRISKLKPEQALFGLMNQIYRPADDYGVDRALTMAAAITEHTEFYTLVCNMQQESAVVAFEGIRRLSEGQNTAGDHP